MAHARNVEALAALLYRAEHWELGMAPAFERLPQLRREEFRRRAQFLSARGVVVPSAVAAELQAALAAQADRASAAEIQETLERIARTDAG